MTQLNQIEMLHLALNRIIYNDKMYQNNVMVKGLKVRILFLTLQYIILKNIFVLI